MSDKQISSVLSRLRNDDPKRKEFLTVVLPALKNVVTIDSKSKFVCPYCKATLISFTNYYAFLRHLTEKHSLHLPCAGRIFEKNISQNKCNECSKVFNRKEHLNAHLKSKAHLAKIQELSIDNSTLSRSVNNDSKESDRYEDNFDDIYEDVFNDEQQKPSKTINNQTISNLKSTESTSYDNEYEDEQLMIKCLIEYESKHNKSNKRKFESDHSDEDYVDFKSVKLRY